MTASPNPSAPPAPAAGPTSAPPPPSIPPIVPPENEVRDFGSGVHPSLRARRWTARGAFKVLGDVDLGSAVLEGTTVIRGRISAAEFQSDGTLEVGGDVNVTGSASFRGSSKLEGNLANGALVTAGRFRVAGSLQTAGLGQVSGTLSAGGDATFGQALLFDGGLDIGGTLRSPRIDGRVRQPSRVGAIVGDTVSIVSPGSPLGPLLARVLGPLLGPLLPTRPELETLRIEAREVRLEGVRCEYVQAERVVLGAGCHIAHVEGTVVRRHPNSYVGPEAAFTRPHGLWR